MALITGLIGSLKKYQLWVCCLIFTSKFGVAYHQMAIIFLAPPVKFTCPNNTTCCDRPTYDKSLFTRTIIMEWHLICERAWFTNLSQTLFQFGVMTGSLLCGMMSDRYGRRPAFITAVVTEVVTGAMAAFMRGFWSFTIVRIIVGFSAGGIMVVGFVMVMEYVGSDKRPTFSCLYQIPFTVGHMLLGLYAYLIRDYVHLLLLISLVNVPLLIYICILPESPRWLLAVNKVDKAVNLLKKIATVNKMPTDMVESTVARYQQERHSSNPDKSGTTADLFRTPNLRKNIIVMSTIWFGCSYVFYGLAQYVGHLTGNMFLNVVASGAVCALGTLLAIPILKHFKRKPSVVLSNAGCGLCIMLISVVPDGICTVLFACIGVLLSFMVFCLVYLYCTEMFPTVVRNAAVGISSMMARVGSMIAPFVVGLKPYGTWCVPVAFGILPLITAALCLLLPETKGLPLLNTIEEGEALGKSFSRPRTATARETGTPVAGHAEPQLSNKK